MKQVYDLKKQQDKKVHKEYRRSWLKSNVIWDLQPGIALLLSCRFLFSLNPPLQHTELR